MLGFSPQEFSHVEFCFNPKNISKEWLGDFYTLKNKKVFDDRNCVTPDSLSDEQRVLVIPFVLKATKKIPFNLYAEKDVLPKKYYFINDFRLKKKAMDFETPTGKKLHAEDLMDTLNLDRDDDYVGTLTSTSLPENDSDHAIGEMKNASLSLGGASLAYIAIERLKVGERLNLSKNTRRCALTVSGALMVFLATASNSGKVNPMDESFAPFYFSCEFKF